MSKGKVFDTVLVILAALIMVTQSVREIDGLPEFDGRIE